MSEKILFICGSLNQTIMMHKIASYLAGNQCYFTPFYSDGIAGLMKNSGLLDHTILAGRHLKDSHAYLKRNVLSLDEGGKNGEYDLVVTCTDLIIQSNIRNRKIVLVQEGLILPEDNNYFLVKYLGFPRFIANTAATGLSDSYTCFCVASFGYRNLFIQKGVKPEKIIVTGIPNFDNLNESKRNGFPFKNYVLAATSSLRETGRYENRMEFLNKVNCIAAGREVIFKLHPNEDHIRAVREIRATFPDSKIYLDGNINHMVANCSMLITQSSSVVFLGLIMKKETHSDLDVNWLKGLLPIQNNGTSAMKIADICRMVLQSEAVCETRPKFLQSIIN